VEELDRNSATDKSVRTQLKQLVFHLDLLSEAGIRIGTRYAKHLEGAFVLLHSFRKSTQKNSPARNRACQARND